MSQWLAKLKPPPQKLIIKVLNIGVLTTHGKYTQHNNVDIYAQGQVVDGGNLIALEDSDKPKRY
ncbi:hypothetical protein [Pleionea sp. CnH1-48]|uniref:hypothetical protein n=1 Tax=Pleionea sp. CnH1-48 TaxID=2954494 RepID=UPI00209743A6|nr:hypothetical protein [Pleionea sp. CnH1-48]MCO7225594.1 hypothetical protein [Pleionea sp. CnH1-48]